MQDNKRFSGYATIAGILSLGMALSATSYAAVPDQPKEWEKCAGVVKAGMNDCSAKDGKHACAGQSKMTNSDAEWVYVPKGTCEKLTGGMSVGMKPAKKS